MPTTSNFGWTTPADTDLVKDGAAAIRTLGNGIDTSFLDLKGGTTGQVLSKNSNTDLDFIWVAQDDSNAIQNAIVDAKGDLISATAADTPARLAVGTNGQVLTADSTTSTGLKWAAPASAMTKITAGAFTNVATVDVDGCFTTTYRNYVVYINVSAATEGDDFQLQYRYSNTTETGLYYGAGFQYQRNNNLTTFGYAGNNEATIAPDCGTTAAGYPLSLYQITFSNVGQGDDRGPSAYGTGYNAVLQKTNSTAFGTGTGRNFDGFRLKSSASNITGNYVVYGLAN